MPFLNGSLGFERFSVTGFEAEFSEEHIEILTQNSSGRFESNNVDNTLVGFLGGDHLFDQAFDLGKNLINDTLHCGIRVDTNQVPSAIKKAWMQMELAALMKDSTTGRPTKVQRQEAKEAVEHRCEVEAATGKYRKMAQFPVLWDLLHSILYFGGSGNAASHCGDLFERAFGIELSRVSAGTIAMQWAQANGRYAELDDLSPSIFWEDCAYSEPSWASLESNAPDYLGNEFLVWLWWKLENEVHTIGLADGSDVAFMLTKTLALECPLGEHGKESITADSPINLPEAIRALQSGKLPRKTGMTLVRHGQQFDLVLQAESFAISGAKIHVNEDDDAHDANQRIDLIRMMCETVDLLFQSFCQLRVESAWNRELSSIRSWLTGSEQRKRKPAA